MTVEADMQPLIDHLCHGNDLSATQARHIVDEVIAYFSETPDQYVRRRHLEIKQESGLGNARIFERLQAEMAQRVFAGPVLTQRQMRRIIYG